MDRKAYLKEWRLKNKEKVKEYQATYFQENKETIYEQRHKHEKETDNHKGYLNQYKHCECGKYLKICSIYMHYKICIEHKIKEII
jgi:hypothetical protein